MMFAPTFLVMVVLPRRGIRFPSILCGFALFFAIATFIIAYLETKLRDKPIISNSIKRK